MVSIIIYIFLGSTENSENSKDDFDEKLQCVTFSPDSISRLISLSEENTITEDEKINVDLIKNVESNKKKFKK